MPMCLAQVVLQKTQDVAQITYLSQCFPKYVDKNESGVLIPMSQGLPELTAQPC